MPELARCRCANGGPPLDGQDFACTATATQEDLLCDDCREGCNFGIAGQPHMAVPNLVIKPAPSRGMSKGRSR